MQYLGHQASPVNRAHMKRPLKQDRKHFSPFHMEVPPGENNYHERNKTALPSLAAVQGNLLMHHTKPDMSQQNLSLVSSALTCDILFQTVHHELEVFLEVLDYQCPADAQVFPTFRQFFCPILLFHHLWVCLVLLQGEIKLYFKVAQNTLLFYYYFIT